LLAERGYQVVVQSCRGTDGSDGVFTPFRDEASDGLATVEWITRQEWFSGSLAMCGGSYLGIVQWAVARERPDLVDAFAMVATTSDPRRHVVFPGGSFSLGTGAFWVDLLLHQGTGPARTWLSLLGGRRRLSRACSHLPLGDADMAGFGARVPFYREWLDHEDSGDPWWEAADFSSATRFLAPSSHVTGWYDLFLAGHLDDYRKLVAARRRARLTVGPWTHFSAGLVAAGIRDSLEFLDAELRGPATADPAGRGAEVRVYLLGAERWVDLSGWPPPSRPRRLRLAPGFRLVGGQPAGRSPYASDGAVLDDFVYDPSDPTPSCGGASLDPLSAGRRDQRPREVRGDVLVYSCERLSKALTVIGHGSVRVWVRSSRPHFDIFVRLCDVDEQGRSTNVCDGVVRVTPDLARPDPDGVVALEIALSPTARHFGRGHRIRLQISGGAHPLFARNPGTGEPLRSSTALVPSYIEVFRSRERPSALVLPVFEG
jgi:putative CocE/NonD family hydrolase